jgi:alpha-L-fucosidase 2
MEQTLWYTTSPQGWMEGLPIGNGRLAAMVWGDDREDRLSLNHEWLWRGRHRERDNGEVAAHLEEIRNALRQDRFFDATALANLHLGGKGGISGLPKRLDAYQPAGDLVFTPEGEVGFQGRSLRLDEAVARTERRCGDTVLHTTCLAHAMMDTVLCRWETQGGVFSGTLRYERVPDPDALEEIRHEPEQITYTCRFTQGLSFSTQIRLRTDGTVTVARDGLRVANATVLMACIDIGTDITGIQEELAAHPRPTEDWDALLSAHRARFSSLMDRLTLSLPFAESDMPTDARIVRMREGAEDPGLVQLLFQYGRYLLVSASLNGALPANLQGKWNDQIAPPWECDYHFDINLQMNYWMAEATNQPECADTLLRFVERFLPHARKAARDLYGCRGVWLPLQSDAWGRATPESHGWAVWIGAAAWMAQHFWWHWTYNGDLDFLKTRAYPFFREVAAFYQDYLVPDESGVLQIMPSQSPENRFAGTGYWPVSIGISSAMDVQLAHDALGYAISSAELLQVDTGRVHVWREMRQRLPAFAIGPDGRLLEWDREREEVELGHRHLSHLYGLHPGTLFNPVERPEQFEAALRSLDFRLAQGGGHTGWSRAWVACLMARAGRGEGVWEHLTGLIRDFSTASLLDLHPPHIFQIDGNLGAVEAVMQGLVQHWAGRVHLLRALPAAWPEGTLTGCKVPGGHRLNLSWRDGTLDKLDVIVGHDAEIRLAGLAGKLQPAAGMPESSVMDEQDGDLLLRGMPGSCLSLKAIGKE